MYKTATAIRPDIKQRVNAQFEEFYANTVIKKIKARCANLRHTRRLKTLGCETFAC